MLFAHSSTHEYRRWLSAFAPGIVAAAAAATVTPQLACGGSGPPANTVFITMGRLADCHQPGTVVFHMTAEVDLADWNGVTGYSVATAAGLSGSTARQNAIEWSFDSLAQLKAAAQGGWEIAIAGDSPSTSTFTMNVAALQDSDIFALATNLAPAQGAVVCPSASCSWAPPASGPFPALGFHVAVRFFEVATQEQLPGLEETSVPDSGATAWDPAGCMLPVGGYSGSLDAVLEVDYASVSAAATASPLVVTQGTIEWGTSPLSPPGFPAKTPLVILSSAQQSCFTVQPCAPADLNCDDAVDGADLGALLGAWGPAAPGAPADFNHDGAVDGADLGALLGAWGRAG